MRPRLRRPGIKENAFTLLELVVVVLIIGILTAIAVPTFATQRRNDTDAATQQGALALWEAADQLHSETTSHPTSRVSMEAILAKHAELLRFVIPGTVLAIKSVDLPSPGYCITASNANGNNFTPSHPYVVDTLLTPAVVKDKMDTGTGACPAGVLTTGLPNEYTVNSDGTITPKSTGSVCNGIVPGPIKQSARYDGGNGNYTPVTVDLVLSSDCSRVTGTVRVTNADKGNPNTVYPLQVSTQTYDANGNPQAITNTASITITGAGSAQVDLPTGLTAGATNKALYFDPSYRALTLGEAYLAWQPQG